MIGRTISGSTDITLIRRQVDALLELGDLLVCDIGKQSTILQICKLETGSDLDKQTIGMMAGSIMTNDVEFYEPDSANYMVATAKPLVSVVGGNFGKPKIAIPIFTPVRLAAAKDLTFVGGEGPGRLRLGKIRSGSKIIEGSDFWLDARSIISHHILVVASTGRGKSNMIKCMLWELLHTGGVGMLVLDAHGEYYAGLSKHPKSHNNLTLYAATGSDTPGSISLKMHVRSVRPDDLRGVVEFSDPQEQEMGRLYGKHGEEWIEELIRMVDEDDGSLKITPIVLCRKIKHILGLNYDGGAFSTEGGERTKSDIQRRLDEGRIVIVDTNGLSVTEEHTIGNMLTSTTLYNRKRAKDKGMLDGLPPIGIVAEEAPRLLSDSGPGNAYAAVAREGRKFNVGLVAVTQLASVIDREVLVNLSTKIIFGNEMGIERKAIIESAAQDLSEDSRNIAALDPGEAIVSSVFAPFAVPIKVPLFEDLVQDVPRPKLKVF